MPRRPRTELSNRERVFVREYLVDLNASQAAIRAGYSPKSIGRNICRVMQRPRVRAAIAEAMAARERDLQIDSREVLREIARLGFANLLDYIRPNADGTADVDLSLLTRDNAAAIAEVKVREPARGGREVKLKLADKSRNLELLARHLGLLPRGRDWSAGQGFGGQGGGDVEMSDLELAQRILGILARADPD